MPRLARRSGSRRAPIRRFSPRLAEGFELGGVRAHESTFAVPAWDALETVDYVAHFDPDNSYDLPERGYQADAYYARIRALRESGRLSSETLERLVDWAEGVWPRGEWRLLRP